MIKYSYNSEKNIITTTREGEIEIDEVVEYIEDIVAEFKHEKCLYIVEDTRNSVFKVEDQSDFMGMLQTIKKHIEKFDKVMVAIVSDDPHNAALSMVYKVMTTEIPNYHIKPFSTIESAKDWLKVFIPA